jgi:L-seryl-tRNA(Ser) seleniumtransferase
MELRDLPSVDELARGLDDPLAAAAARTVLERAREEIRAGADPGDLSALLQEELRAARAPSLRRVLNATGVIVHTNLGRAPLAEEALAQVLDAARGYSNLELDLREGARGSRQDHVAPLLRRLTGAEAALVVNNNAASVLLALAALAEGREVVVSRGELIEIGDGFRIPDVLVRSGARLVEVGTTNRTRAGDYERAVGPDTALLLRVHQSNFRVVGFAELPRVEELAAVARRHGVPLVDDLGSGVLTELAGEPSVKESLAAGADLVCFSGDKLLGGPQAGLLVGRADLIAKIRKHPLKRALRVGKLTLAALEPVLALYRSPEFLIERLTTLQLLTRLPSEMQAQAVRLRPIVQRAIGDAYEVADAQMTSQIGSGALPVDTLPSHGLAIRVVKGKRGSLDRLEGLLRGLSRPVIGRVSDKTLWLDMRCLSSADEAAFVDQWGKLAP